MKSLLQNRLNVVWLVLVGATCASWWLGIGHGPGQGATTVGTVVVLAITFVKVGLIGNWFMELRTAPRHLRVLFYGWCGLVGVVLIALYLTG